jgi:hypothetical protein
MVLGKDLGVGQESDNGPQCPRTPPTMLHPTLSSWLENMNKLKDLIDRLQELASAAPSDHRPQLQRQVAMLRATFKKQQERCIEFLRLSEEYANRYLLDISAEIQQQSSFLEMLEKRLDMAKTLHGQAVHLRKSYESRTVDAMKNVCETGESIFLLTTGAENRQTYHQRYPSRFLRTLTFSERCTLCLVRSNGVTRSWTNSGRRR